MRSTGPAVIGLVILVAACRGDHSHDDDHAHGTDHEHGGEHGHGAEHGHDDEHGHGHGDGIAIGITRWTDTLELFAEHPPAVAGHETPFLAHLTILDGFRALERAEVTLALDGPAHIEARVTEMLRPGIFQPVFTATTPGTYTARLIVRGTRVEHDEQAARNTIGDTAGNGAGNTAGSTAGNAIGNIIDDTIDGFEIIVYDSEDAALRAHQDDGEDGGEAITFLKEQQWQIPFATAFATRGTLVPAVEVGGEVTTPPGGQAEISAAIAGRVVAPAGGLLRPGQTVRKGQLLATIAPAPTAPEEAARAGLAVAEAAARAQAARAAVERAERLMADRAISQRALDDARRELAVADKAVVAARRAAELFSGAASGRGAGTYRITSPISGVVTEVRASAGKTVAAGELLARVIDLSELWIRARVPEHDAARLRADQDAAYRLTGSSDWLPIDITAGDEPRQEPGPEPGPKPAQKPKKTPAQEPRAAVVSVGHTVDARSRTVDVIYSLAHPDERLRVGALVRVSVPAGDPMSGVIVPADAVLEHEGRALVYVQVEGEAFEERAVRLGASSGERVVIEQGVAAGERVVTRGANVIRLSARASSTPAHGHVH